MPRVKLFDENIILTKAMNLFWKQGFAATSIQDLVNHLGINRASIYDTFGDKDTLFKKSFALYREQNIEGLHRFFENTSEVKQGFFALFDSAIKDAILDKEHKGCFVVNTTTELIPNDKSLSLILEKNKKDILAIFIKYLKSGYDKGQFKTKQDLESIATLFYTIYNGIRVVSKVSPSKQELTNSINVALSLLD